MLQRLPRAEAHRQKNRRTRRQMIDETERNDSSDSKGCWPVAAIANLVIALIVVGVVVHVKVSAAFGAWVVAAGIASAVLLLNAWIEVNITHKWPDAYLWLC